MGNEDDTREGQADRRMLAYFSHSYRPEQKRANLRVWQLLNKWNMHFTVDPKGSEPRPMDITELESMMRQSACFVAVIPYRNQRPWNCSPHQLFEHGLAIRAHKPRLLFVEDQLGKAQFAPEISTIIPFQNHMDWFDEHEEAIAEQVALLAEQARHTAPDAATLKGPAGILVGKARPYSRTRQHVKNLVREIGYDPMIIELSDFENEYLLLSKLHQCSVLICEVRPPHLSLDLLGIIHGSAVPTIRICHLDKDDPQELEKLMMLRLNSNFREINVADRNQSRIPWIYAGYKVDDGMSPIVFWKNVRQLKRELERRLQRLDEKRERDLDRIDSHDKALEYFLRLGRLHGQVFISNAGNLNPFVEGLKQKFRAEGVPYFHYTDHGAMSPGEPDYQRSLRRNIEGSAVFLALTNQDYHASEECTLELEAALSMYYEGRILIQPYLMEKGTPPPESIGRMHAASLYKMPAEEQQNLIVSDVIGNLEVDGRLKFDRGERSALLRALNQLDRNPKTRNRLLKLCGFNATVFADKFAAIPEDSFATEVLDALHRAARWSLADAGALGRLILRLARRVDDDRVRGKLADIVVQHRLLPDIKAFMKHELYREIGMGFFGRKLQLFDAIRKSKPDGARPTDDPLDQDEIAGKVLLAGESDDWERSVVEVGNALGELSVVKTVHDQIGELVRKSGDIGRDDVGVCIAGEGHKGLMVPFEWSAGADGGPSLSYCHPVRRILIDVGKTRRALRSHYLNESYQPLRALLVAANTGDLPEVEAEIEWLKARLSKWYEILGWPFDENVTVLSPRKATVHAIKKHLTTGEYDLLHLAGHAAEEDEQPGIALPTRAGSYNFVSADKLHLWIRNSGLRFVYLGCCHGAEPRATKSDRNVVRFDNLVQAVVRAKVPEVVGFLWPIEDEHGRRFAEEFYKSFLKSLRPATAIFAARKAFEHNEQVIAAPVLYSQVDTDMI